MELSQYCGLNEKVGAAGKTGKLVKVLPKGESSYLSREILFKIKQKKKFKKFNRQ